MTDISKIADKVLDQSDPQESGCLIYKGKVPILEAMGSVYVAVGRHVAEGLYVVSKCGSARCVNPDHMGLKISARVGPPSLPSSGPAPLASPVVVSPDPPTAKVPRRIYLKSDQQIKSYIAGAMRQYSTQPVALLHILSGYVAQLQEEMKRESEDTFADRVCEMRHPGKPATGVYCRLCHSAEMAGKFGSLPGGHPAGDLVFPGDSSLKVPVEGVPTDEEMLLEGVVIKKG